MRKILFILLFFSGLTASAQWSVGFYPYPYSRVELTSNPGSRLFGGLRVQTNSFASNLNTDLNFYWNFKREKNLNAFASGGLRFNIGDLFGGNGEVFRSYLFSAGMRIRPLNDLPRLGLSFDVGPVIHPSLRTARIESNVGLFWVFGGKED